MCIRDRVSTQSTWDHFRSYCMDAHANRKSLGKRKGFSKLANYRRLHKKVKTNNYDKQRKTPLVIEDSSSSSDPLSSSSSEDDMPPEKIDQPKASGQKREAIKQRNFQNRQKPTTATATKVNQTPRASEKSEESNLDIGSLLPSDIPGFLIDPKTSKYYSARNQRLQNLTLRTERVDLNTLTDIPRGLISINVKWLDELMPARRTIVSAPRRSLTLSSLPQEIETAAQLAKLTSSVLYLLSDHHQRINEAPQHSKPKFEAVIDVIMNEPKRLKYKIEKYENNVVVYAAWINKANSTANASIRFFNTTTNQKKSFMIGIPINTNWNSLVTCKIHTGHSKELYHDMSLASRPKISFYLIVENSIHVIKVMQNFESVQMTSFSCVRMLKLKKFNDTTLIGVPLGDKGMYQRLIFSRTNESLQLKEKIGTLKPFSVLSLIHI
eukprot:TRINITY_DN16874_c0_g2_i2.p1 TRINITY_DN16874_c0_g2~~TRINITY_DN16874_c0_g2_i2.p1  ORF type:complete len:459 (+),score=44.19 TRINITY_DN16874_c0_g2_i2:64-1377(+)